MFACKSCGGPLRFDIASQMLHCSYCDNNYDPYSLKDDGEADEAKEYNATIYTCPQCGAEMGGTQTSAAEFCSFCGGSTVLTSRISKMKKPEYVIPFKQTKENCVENLRKELKKQLFIEGGFKNAEVERFRGIYMPCWNYHVTSSSKCSLRTTEDKNGYTYYYALEGQVDADYRGIPHDASEQFSDYISEILEPYNYREKKPFASSFLAGFFSDIQDVDPSKYENDACMIAAQDINREFLKDYKIQHGTLQSVPDKELPGKFAVKTEETECTLIPVWFMSYRMKDRVAYAAVNGETGKVVSDAPLSIGKIWACAAVLAIPIFLFLNMFVEMNASSIVLPVNFMLAIAALVNLIEMSRIKERDKNANWVRANRASAKSASPGKAEKKGGKVMKIIGLALLVLLLAIPVLIIAAIGISIAAVVIGIVYMAAAFLGGILFAGLGVFYNKYEGTQIVLGFAAMLAASILSDIIYFVNPISDLWFYFAAILDLAAILFALTNILTGLNRLTTSPLPQFMSRGGDNHENDR